MWLWASRNKGPSEQSDTNPTHSVRRTGGACKSLLGIHVTQTCKLIGLHAASVTMSASLANPTPVSPSIQSCSVVSAARRCSPVSCSSSVVMYAPHAGQAIFKGWLGHSVKLAGTGCKSSGRYLASPVRAHVVARRGSSCVSLHRSPLPQLRYMPEVLQECIGGSARALQAALQNWGAPWVAKGPEAAIWPNCSGGVRPAVIEWERPDGMGATPSAVNSACRSLSSATSFCPVSKLTASCSAAI